MCVCVCVCVCVCAHACLEDNFKFFRAQNRFVTLRFSPSSLTSHSAVVLYLEPGDVQRQLIGPQGGRPRAGQVECGTAHIPAPLLSVLGSDHLYLDLLSGKTSLEHKAMTVLLRCLRENGKAEPREVGAGSPGPSEVGLGLRGCT